MQDLLRSVWDEPRAPNPPVRVWRDWMLAGLLVSIVLLEGLLRPDFPARVAWVVVVLGLVPTVLWRRTHPLLMLAIAFGVSALPPLVTGAPPDLYASALLLVLPYALVRWGSGSEVIFGSMIVLGKVGLWLVLGYVSLPDTIGGLGVLFSTAGLGAATRYRYRAREREFDQVKSLERERLARDLHDTVAHHMAAIAIRAQAGIAVAPIDPNAAVDSLQVIEAEASRALAEMRAMVRVLRHDQPAERTPTQGIAELEQLVGQARTGPLVDVEILGDVDGLPPSVGMAIFRLAQESVTNAQRHARHATRIEVRVAADDTSVHLRVSDDGDTGAALSNGGYGLIGMIERADLLGGVCQAGPNPDRGWTVTASLPRVPA